MDVEIKTLPEIWLAYIRQIGQYGLKPTIKTLNRVTRWARSRQILQGAQVLGIPWHNPKVTPHEECWYDACVTVPPGFSSDHPSISVQVIPPSRYLVRTCRAVDGDLESPWQEFLRWYRESGWEMTSEACFESYLNESYQDPTGNWDLALHIPVSEKRQS